MTTNSCTHPLPAIMWKPQDECKTPYVEDNSLAKDVIGRLQMELCAIGNLLPASEAHFRRTLRRLEDTSTWISPVRMLPFEILSSIFIMASQQEWKAPLRIVNVCHFWRDVVLATPQAWAFIDFRDFPKVQTVSMFIERSGRCPLHCLFTISFQSSQAYYSALSSRIINRIHCLVVTRMSMNLLLERYPNLTRLTVDKVSTSVPLEYLDISRLPNLRYFEGSFSKVGIARDIASCQTFPRLENMVITTDSQLAWVDAVRACSRTLTSCHIFIGDKVPAVPALSIQFPKLERLSITSRPNSHTNWKFTANTPVLETYSLNFVPEKHSVTIDPEIITHLQCRKCITLDPYPKLRYLRMLCPKSQGLRMVDLLRRDHNLCVTLERIGLGTWEQLDANQINKTLRQRNKSTKVNLKVEYIDREASWAGNIRLSVSSSLYMCQVPC